MPGWQGATFAEGAHEYPIYRRGSGPGVIIVHELPGLTSEVIAFADEVVERGYTVVLPHLFGQVNGGVGALTSLRAFAQVCVASEFTKLATGVTAPLASWLRSLARTVHSDCGGVGVGALGMCFTGGFALAMMVDDAVVAPVVAQPAAPFAIGRARAADLNLSPTDARSVADRAAAGCPVLGVKYEKDPSVGTRFATLTDLLGENFRPFVIPGRGHATLTEQRSDAAVAAILEFFDERLRAGGG